MSFYATWQSTCTTGCSPMIALENSIERNKIAFHITILTVGFCTIFEQVFVDRQQDPNVSNSLLVDPKCQ